MEACQDDPSESPLYLDARPPQNLRRIERSVAGLACGYQGNLGLES